MRVLAGVAALSLAVVLGCGSSGPPPVSFVSNEQPSAQGAPNTNLDRGAARIENPNGGGGGNELAQDESRCFEYGKWVERVHGRHLAMKFFTKKSAGRIFYLAGVTQLRRRTMDAS